MGWHAAHSPSLAARPPLLLVREYDDSYWTSVEGEAPAQLLGRHNLNDQMPTLRDLIPQGTFVGTSLILHRGGRFLYGMRPAKDQDGRLVIELTGIGGGVEAVDQSYSAGVLREAREEIASQPGDVELVPCSETVVVRGPTQIERVRLKGSERPAALVYRCHRTPPHQPWHSDNTGEGWLIVFLAELKGRPRPIEELPWLMWLTAEQVLETALQDVPLASVLAAGADLVMGPSGSPPEMAWVRLTDSQEALGVALGQALPAFYRSLLGKGAG